ncbi:MAG: hypothetical protein Q8R98_11895 [Rubrivivax sp.]|nr:hypothetical protein [Rubrivivax sp.]MDP3223702.1 hypothetical protein [Rubrivivax sp.]MDP3612547.1 hypothetical protein [Rubrivivax sp.]
MALVALGLPAEGLMRQRDGLVPEHDWLQHAGAAGDGLGVSEDEVGDWDHPLQPVLDEVHAPA